VQVAGSRTLEFAWSLHGRTDAEGVTEFEFGLPAALVSRVVIDTRNDRQLTCDRGIVGREMTIGGTLRWTIDLGTHSQCRVRIGSADADESAGNVSLRQITSYRIWERGADVTCKVTVESPSERLSQFLLTYDKELHPVEVLVDSRPAVWSLSSYGNAPTFVVELARPGTVAGSGTGGANFTIQVTAFAPVVMGTSWRLPRIVAATDGWLQERVFVTVAKPLTLRNLQLADCRQVAVSSDALSPRIERTISIQLMRPTAEIDVWIDNAEFAHQVVAATHVELNETTARATTRATIRARRGRTFQIEAIVRPDWIVESVEIDPSAGPSANRIDAWTSAPDGDNQQLRIDLVRPLSAEAPITLVVHASRRITADLEIPVRDLTPIEYPAALATRDLLAVSTSEPFRIAWRGGRLAQWMAAQDLAEDERGLWENTPTGAMLLVDQHAVDLGLRLTRAESKFHSQIVSHMNVTRGTVEQRIEIEVTPDAGSLRFLSVEISHNAEGFQWFVENSPNPLPLTPKAESIAPNRTLLSIELPEPRDTAFRLIGHRVLSTSNEIRVPLARLPAATSQTGRAIISAAPDTALIASPHPMMRSLLPDAGESTGPPGYRFHYGYAPESQSFEQPWTFRVADRDEGANRLSTIRLFETKSSVAHDGHIVHEGHLLIDNLGDSHLRVTIPEPLKIMAIAVAGRALETPTVVNNILDLPLPPHERYVDISLTCEAIPMDNHGTGRTATYPGWEADAPVLRHTWRLWLPPDVFMARPPDPQSIASTISSVTHRFFGPYFGSLESMPFDFFSDHSWFALTERSTTADAKQAMRRLRRVMDEALDSDAENLTWRDVIQKFDDANRVARSRVLMMLWIDEKRLAARDIRPTTPYSRPAQSRDVLRHFDLVVIACGRYFALTTAEAASEFASEIDWTDVTRLGMVGSRMAAAKGASYLHAKLGNLVEVSAWSSTSDPVHWPDGESDVHEKLLEGWTSGTREPLAGERVVRLHDRRFVWRLAAIGFLVAASLAWWLSERGPRWSTLAVVGAAAICLLIAEPFATAGCLFFWGTVLGIIIRWLHPKPQTKTVVAPSTTVPVGRVAVTSMVLWLLLTILGVARAETSPAEHEPSVLDVYTPTDNVGNPVGDYVYVPRDFYEFLVKREAVFHGRSNKWMIQSAEYRAAATAMSKDGSVEINTITAVYRIQTLADDVTITLRLPAGTARNLERTATLNGKSIRLDRVSENEVVEVEIWEAGTYRLELTFRVSTVAEAGWNVVELPIIPVWDATLHVSTFADIEQVEVATRLGSVQSNIQQAHIAADLGPVNRLSIRWPMKTSMMDDTPSARQLVWLIVNEDQVVANLRVRIDVRQGPLNPVSVIVDDRLHVQNLANAKDKPSSIESFGDGSMKRLVFHPTIDEAGQAAMDVSFVLGDSSGLGRVRVPRIEVRDLVMTDKFLAVTLHDRIRGNPIQAVAVDAVQTTRLGTLLPTTARAPDFVYQIRRDHYDLVFETAPLVSPPIASSDCIYEISGTATGITFIADLDPNQQRMFGQRLYVPPDVDVLDVTATLNNQPIAVDWSRGPRELLMVSFPQAISQPYRLRVLGRMASHGDRIDLPTPRVADVVRERERAVLVRHSNVRVQPVVVNGFREITDGNVREAIRGGLDHQNPLQMVGVWSRVAEDASINLTIGSETNAITGSLTAIFNFVDGIWSYHLDCRVTVASGELDTVRFRVPTTWSRGTITGMAADAIWSAGPDARTKYVTVRPVKPISGTARLGFVGQLPSDSRGPTGADLEFGIEGAASVERYICLPHIDESTWAATGLAAVSAPLLEGTSSVTADTHDLYRIDSDRGGIQQVPANTPGRAAGIESIHHHVWFDGYASHVISEATLLWQSETPLALRIPDGISIQQLLLNDTPVHISTTTGQTAIVDIPNSEQRQEVRVVWTDENSPIERAAEFHLHAPRFGMPGPDGSFGHAIPVDTTVWQVGGSQSQQALRIIDVSQPAGGSPSVPIAQTSFDLFDRHDVRAFAFPGDVATIMVSRQDVGHGEWLIRVLAVGVIALGGMAFQKQIQSINPHEFALWIRVVGVLFGLGWWMFLTPSLFGWLIVLLTIIASWLVRS
jgi:hypothetical protein